MQKISLIAAMTLDRVIGLENRMPWHLPADLKHFKAITLDKPVIMGRKTFLSIGKALPGRRNIVITHDLAYQAPGCEVAHSLEEALQMTREAPECMIIGGGQIFEAALPLATHMYLTVIDIQTPGDAYFPRWAPEEWNEIARETHTPDEKNPYVYTFVTLEKHKIS